MIIRVVNVMRNKLIGLSVPLYILNFILRERNIGNDMVLNIFNDDISFVKLFLQICPLLSSGWILLEIRNYFELRFVLLLKIMVGIRS